MQHMNNERILFDKGKQFRTICPQRGDHGPRRVAWVDDSGPPEVSDRIRSTGKNSGKSCTSRDFQTSVPRTMPSCEDENADQFRTNDDFGGESRFLFEDEFPSPDDIIPLGLENEDDLAVWEVTGFM